MSDAAPALRTLTVSARDGASLGILQAGGSRATSGAAPLLLVHSIGLSADAWRPFLQATPDFEAVAVDVRGHGGSSAPVSALELDVLADDLADVLDSCGFATAVVVGASMGGVVALVFALRHPDRVSALGLVDTTAWYGPDAAERWEARARQAETEGLVAASDFQLARWFTDEFRRAEPALATATLDLFLATDPQSFAAACRMMGSFDLRSQLGRIDVPTRILVGDEDYATPFEMALELEQGIRGSRLTLLPQTRHLSFIERPEVVADAIRALVR
jgi:3-oxoadipate enol-lactonase